MPHRPAPLPLDDAARLDALRRYDILDTPAEESFDDIVLIASEICGTPISLVSLVDSERQWFKARVGLPVQQTHRDFAFCGHAILSPDELFVIEDAECDSRFRESPLVLGDPRIRFYAGAPIVTPAGHALGTVCVIDVEPRSLTESQRRALTALARQAASVLELRERTAVRETEANLLRQQVSDALGNLRESQPLQHSQRVASVGQLTGGIAHDFNNLLQSIAGSLQLIRRRASNAEQVAKWADSGLRAVERGAKLTLQLLTFSRSQALDARPLEVDAVVSRMEELLVRTLGPEIRLHFALDAADALVLGDATQLESAVLNLAINARDAMQGSGRIDISTRAIDVVGDDELADGPFVELQIADDGPGMPPAVVARAFDPFFTTKPAGKGTGLGLSQVRAFAQSAGGTARIRTGAGGGTALSLWLRRVARAAAGDAVAGHVIAAPAPSNARLLLVDDDPELRSTFGELLEDAGYRVRSVASGGAAISAIHVERPDLVLIDCAMPGLNGTALASMLGQLDPDLPLIFITGHVDTAALVTALGADSVVLQKPLSLEAVVVAIEGRLAAR